MPQVTWLILGAGDIVRKRVAPALLESPLSSMEAVCGRSSGRARELAAEFRIPRWFNNAEQALRESGAGAVYIATPVDTHIPLGIAALRAGKHVLIEKPLGLNGRECAALAQEATERGLTAGCAYYRRCFPRYEHLRQVLANRTLGQLVSVRMQYASWYQPSEAHWRTQPEHSGGGVLADMGSHMFDVVIGLFGRPRILSAATYHHTHSYTAEDSAAVLAELPWNVPLLADFHWCSRTWSHELTVTGSDGRLEWSPFDSGPVVITSGRDRSVLDLPAAPNVHLPLVEDFARAISEARPPLCSVSEALMTSELLDEIYLAAGQTVASAR